MCGGDLSLATTQLYFFEMIIDAMRWRFKVPPLTHYGRGAVMTATCALTVKAPRGDSEGYRPL